ncbi:CPBP family intramembrane glutamic endopeptidase [Acidipila rosea]|uniref:Membrane protease YdiL (CAAX protease family) n=1 Tax=Acidipila rosea TaxID=768535 RepID=A0A4V2PUW5_9BACT|nr:type II CAAX endopeptidase family protein [Acidipila rosea]MBW4028573.1 CPBP family intramembrane metalloprotease [Acidobacteriota bacterium]MBW4045202.1 CPBP family intramembrane metalloprotease [Acidobacteriota bacterium]TCK72041.1 membrane protease YdiL (CAAX protease family) [Acidipila rosea]
MPFLLAAFLIVVVPIWDYWYTLRLKRSTEPNKKIRAYAVTALWLWVATAIVWARMRPGFGYRLNSSPTEGLTGGFVYGLMLAIAIGLALPVVAAARNLQMREKVKKQLSRLAFFLPVTRRERQLFALLSITAGVCEETLYRGFLFHYFAHSWNAPLWGAVVLAAVAFGLGHGYQGISGILATTVLGGVFSAAYLATGSLLLPMVVHALIDLRILLFPAVEGEMGAPVAGLEQRK